MKRIRYRARWFLRRNSILLSVVVLSGILFLACKPVTKDDPFACNVEVDPWASESSTFSWTDYNSLSEVHDYFVGHDSTIIIHVGDTLKFWGWVYFHGPGEPVYWPGPDPDHDLWTADTKFIHLVESEDHHDHHEGNKHAVVCWSDAFLQENPWFTVEFDSLLQKKWYVTAVLEEEAEVLSPCYRYVPKYVMVALDTLINNS